MILHNRVVTGSSDAIALCAAGDAAWQATAYRSLGYRWTAQHGYAAGVRLPHPYLLGAITLSRDALLPAGLPGTIRDSWSVLEHTAGEKRHAVPADPWMLRLPSALDRSAAKGVRVEPTSDALLFERVAFEAAAGEAPVRPGQLHPAGSHRSPGLHLLLAWRDDRPIGTALVVVHATGVLVSAVAVLASERGVGVGSMLTAAAVAHDLSRPATLSASDLGRNVYLRLGFEFVANPTDWKT